MEDIHGGLVVVVPAYRSTYLEEALESLATQTREVAVRVFDDASTDPIEEVCGKFRGRMDIRYHRFAENLGGRDLAAHWNRCIERVDAEWIWLFSDDDVADPGCAEAVESRILAGSAVDVLCFRSRTIGPDGKVVRDHPPPPIQESAEEFLAARIAGRRESFVPDHVFRRRRWMEVGGFPSYPLAWHSDDAFWIEAAKVDGIAGLDAVVNWRRSGRNLSSFDPATCDDKYKALCLFDDHLARHHWWETLSPPSGSRDSARRAWFWSSLQAIGWAFPPPVWPRMRREMSSSFPQGGISILFSFLRSWLFRLTHPVG